VNVYDAAEDLNVMIVKSSGKLVASKVLNKNGKAIVAESLAPGVYFVYIKKGYAPMDTKKIIIK
jgi:hypothetical protein